MFADTNTGAGPLSSYSTALQLAVGRFANRSGFAEQSTPRVLKIKRMTKVWLPIGAACLKCRIVLGIDLSNSPIVHIANCRLRRMPIPARRVRCLSTIARLDGV